MRRFRLTERRVALVCAIVLATLSVTAAWRQHVLQQSASTSPAQEARQDVPSTEEPSDDTSKGGKTDESQSAAQDGAVSHQVSYSFTAVAGSSYTDFARQAIESYAQAHSLQPTADQLINAEVTLANAAGSPILEIGQQVSITQQDTAQALQVAGVVAQPTVANKQPTSSTGTPAQETFTAAMGDSYTTLARQCIASYIQHQAISLSTAQRVAAETYLVQSAGAPLLDVGQQVTVPQAGTSQAVSQAQHLSASEQSAWQLYADAVAW